MCVVSNMGDMGRQIWPKPWTPNVEPWGIQATPSPYNGPTKEQFEEFLELMRAARKFDLATGQKDCPVKDKTDWLRELAEHLGLDPKKVDEVLS